MQQKKKEAEKRLMIIVWKWRHINNDTLPLPVGSDTDMVQVNGREYQWLMRYDPEDIEQSIDQIRQIIKNDYPAYKVQLFLHLNHNYEPGHVEQINASGANGKPPDNCILFGNRDHLYIHHANSPLGLLASNGNMEGNFSGNIISAVEKINEKNVIKSTHFDNVWNHYHHRIKLEAYQLKEDFIRVLWPASLSTSAPDPTVLASILHRLSTYADKIQQNASADALTFSLGKAEEERSQTNFYGSDIVPLFISLSSAIHDFIAKEPDIQLSKPAMEPLREAFHNLLNALPENTYA